MENLITLKIKTKKGFKYCQIRGVIKEFLLRFYFELSGRCIYNLWYQYKNITKKNFNSKGVIENLTLPPPAASVDYIVGRLQAKIETEEDSEIEYKIEIGMEWKKGKNKLIRFCIKIFQTSL